ncbi:hypothetical protein RFI_38050 [Reticulomyxa filosa]|uniref:Uncharacterized protein n=1 Tax=Reticulomyxa filosa TaxID=46433 RepID=X6LFD3_RETFI|nr:hypothetical protein RFI_38050 [Reticulomyxa filosa]|eukprot:ETN99424.1 hypothetical protein RFI_38050 [Reticulomyxa filosa]
MEDEILSFLKNPPVEMRQEQAEALCKMLRDDQECTCMEDVTRLTEKEWEEAFSKVELKIATKVRLYRAIKDMSKKRSIPTPVEITEVVLVSKIVKRINKAYVTLKNNTQVEIYLNDEKWKHLEMQEGDEIKCHYSINESRVVTIHDIQFSDIYSANVLVSSKESITHIVPLSMQSRGLEQKVCILHICICYL